MNWNAINGERLTTWAVTPDGERVRLSFENDAGQPCALSLPISLLSALLMTIPRMLRQALEARCADGSLRMIHELGDWRLEHPAGGDGLILSLVTPDGFEVAFAVPTPQAGRLGESLRRFTDASAVSAATIN